MPIRDWFKRKRERTPGGSQIVRSTPKSPQEQLGFPEEDTTGFRQLRDRVYKEFFGEPESVSHEILPFVPHIDVCIYPPGHAGRPSYTLATSGMSDAPMTLDNGMERSHARREIILYCDAPDEEYVSMVRFFAHFPFEHSTWLGHGHTVPNGDPPAPMFDGSELVAALLIDTIVRPDNGLAEKVIIDGDPVQFLWIVPITQAELDYALHRGVDALLDIFDDIRHPPVLNPRRASYL